MDKLKSPHLPTPPGLARLNGISWQAGKMEENRAGNRPCNNGIKNTMAVMNKLWRTSIYGPFISR
jgi:hypothetical protein